MRSSFLVVMALMALGSCDDSREGDVEPGEADAAPDQDPGSASDFGGMGAPAPGGSHSVVAPTAPTAAPRDEGPASDAGVEGDSGDGAADDAREGVDDGDVPAPGELAAQTLAVDGAIYVAPDGDDLAPGTSAEPIRSLDVARLAVRAFKVASGTMAADIHVVLRGGRWFLDAPVVFDENDSGTDGHRVVYEAAPGEAPVLSGGVKIDSPWTCDASGVCSTSFDGPGFRTLFVDGHIAIRARGPNRVEDAVGTYERASKASFSHVIGWWDHRQGVRIPKGAYGGVDLETALSGSAQTCGNNPIEAVLNLSYAQVRFRVKQWASGTWSDGTPYVSLAPCDEEAPKLDRDWPPKLPGTPFFLENAAAFVDSDDEWFFDPDAKTLRYLPRRDASGSRLDPASSEIVVPRLEHLLVLRGSDVDHPVHDIDVRGLTLEHTAFEAPTAVGFVELQGGLFGPDGSGNTIPPAAVEIESAHGIVLDGLSIRLAGGTAVSFVSATEGNALSASTIRDIAGIGVAMGIDDRAVNVDPRYASKDDHVEDNHIERIGIDYAGSIAVFGKWITGARISRNEIHSTGYSAVNLGWGLAWYNLDLASGGPAYHPVSDNWVTENHIYEPMTMLYDGAAIYTQCGQPGTAINQNVISGIVPSGIVTGLNAPSPVVAIYLDQGSQGISVSGNRVLHFFADATNIISAVNDVAACAGSSAFCITGNGFSDNYWSNDPTNPSSYLAIAPRLVP